MTSTPEVFDVVLTGRKIVRYGGHGWFQSKESLIHGPELPVHSGRPVRFGVVEAEGVFHARPMSNDENSPHYHTIDIHHHTRATIYQPIHPSQTLDDIEGATYCRDDGTHWTDFSHESPGQRHEAEAYAQAKLISHFQPVINKQDVLVHKASDTTQRTLQVNALEAMHQFLDIALSEVSDSIRVFPLGHFRRVTPHADNHRALLVAALRAAMVTLKERGKTDSVLRFNISRVETSVNELVATFTQAPKILSRVEDIEASKPKVAEQINAVTMVANGAPNGIDLRNKFTARDPLTYEAVSSDINVATVSVNRGMLTVTPVNAGSATITVRATAPDERYVTQTFSVTVVTQ